MDTMTGDEKNLKDSSSESNPMLKDSSKSAFLGRLNKLVTALFMVTDIMDREEPLKAKLRLLGTEVISSAYQSPARAGMKISEILSFLDIAATVGMISGMNAGILKKEFVSAKQSIEESMGVGESAWLEKMISAPAESDIRPNIVRKTELSNYQGQSTRLGVQKGSTLLKALSDKISVGAEAHAEKDHPRDNFDLLKQQRRNEILKIVSDKKEATITEIRTKAKELSLNSQSVLENCSEKTLQRELLSMLKDNLLKKTGEKRWSKYFLA
jgi:hypothetical protein